MRSVQLFILATIASLAGGCATWSTSDLVTTEGVSKKHPTDIVLTQNDIGNRKYRVLGDINVTVNKTTIFNADPTRAHVDVRLKERAAAMNADAVILVRYGTVGIGLASWGSLDGNGRAVQFVN